MVALARATTDAQAFTVLAVGDLVPYDYWDEVVREDKDHKHRDNHRDPHREITNPRRHIEMRQGARVILKSRERYE
jgi:hypothetical protein